MRVGLFVPEEPEMHVQALSAFAGGLRRLQVDHFIAKLSAGWRPCDVAVTFGIEKAATPRGLLVGEIATAQTAYGGEHLVIERGFIHREQYFMAGWGGLNGRADFCNDSMPSDRWDELRLQIDPWRTRGNHIVLCGQVPWDASVQHTDHSVWCRQTAMDIRSFTDRPIIFRPHPLVPNGAIDMSGTDVIFTQNQSLAEDLREAWCAVTFNSNSAVEAALSGIPVFAFDRGSMALPVANRSLEQIEAPTAPDRQAWLNNLAYTQWTFEEMSLGLPWLHLSKKTNIQKPTWFRRYTYRFCPRFLRDIAADKQTVMAYPSEP